MAIGSYFHPPRMFRSGNDRKCRPARFARSERGRLPAGVAGKGFLLADRLTRPNGPSTDRPPALADVRAFEALSGALTHPIVRVAPAIPLRYRSRGWDLVWVHLRTDGAATVRRLDPLTQAWADTPAWRNKWAVHAVVVVLPLVPVMLRILGA